MNMSTPESQEPMWVLQLPFIAEPGITLSDERQATFAGYNATFRPGPCDYTTMIISGLESEQAARDLFAAVRAGLFAASLMASWGIRTREEVQVIGKGKSLQEALGPFMSGVLDLPLIYQEGTDLQRIVVQEASITKQLEKVWPNLVRVIDAAITRKFARTLTDERVKLAFELYVDSYFERSDSARFLGLIVVLEVLKDKAPSISRGITSVVKRHLGPDRTEEVTLLYGMRCDLVHEGKRLDNPWHTVNRAQKLVADLLADILNTGSL